jgi:hypothetical protein
VEPTIGYSFTAGGFHPPDEIRTVEVVTLVAFPVNCATRAGPALATH